MKIIEALVAIKTAMDMSANNKSDTEWLSTVNNIGLTPLPDKGASEIDEDFLGTFGDLQIYFRHTCRDTSRTFSIGPDRTILTLELRSDGKVVDKYTTGYES